MENIFFKDNDSEIEEYYGNFDFSIENELKLK